MKKTYITPAIDITRICAEKDLVSATFDPTPAQYAWTDDDYFTQHGGSGGNYDGAGGIIRWGGSDDGEIDGDDMFAKGCTFGCFWDL